MDYPSVAVKLILFILALTFSGLLSGVKTVLGFYQKQDLDLTLSGSSSRFQDWIEHAARLWKRPGFFESMSIGRFIFDSFALFFGARFFVDALSMAWGWGFTVSALVIYLISHWGIPVLAQAYAPSLGGMSHRLYRIYDFAFMGGIGRVVYDLNQMLLRRLGHEPRLSFLGETGISHLQSEQEDENPDRSGLEEEEKEMIRSIFDLRETQAKEIMTPRVDVVALDVKTGYREAMNLIKHEKYSRIPVYEEDIDHIKGILHVMDLMGLPEEAVQEGFHLKEHIRETYFVPRTKKIGDLMHEFRQKHIHMAIVVDEYGGTSGIVTLEDILEEIVGEIHDEDEVETQKIKRIEEGVHLVDPFISLSDLKEELDIDLRPEDDEIHIDTLGGFILYAHGRIPDKGDVIRHKGHLFEIVEMDGNKIKRIRLVTNSALESQSPKKTPQG